MITVTLVGIGIPEIVSSKKNGDRAESVSNAKQVGLALFTFREDYGSLPSKATAIEVRNNNPNTTAALGSASSNDFFRQLFAAGTVDSEKPFFARTQNCRRPDNVLTAGKCLEKGEVGFAYVVSHAACKNLDFPLILTPMMKGKLLFDSQSAMKFFDGRVVVLWADNAVTIETVDKEGRAMINGKDLFDPTQPYWHGIPPKVAWPE